jgi:hypothetical protein
MLSMGTSVKYVTLLFIWAGLFSVAYNEIPSKAEEQLLQMKHIISTTEEYNSFTSAETIFLDQQQELVVQSNIHQDPFLVYSNSKARLTETESFEFEMFFQADVIYFHTLHSEDWKKADYTHPVAGQIEGLRNPIAFWMRLIPQIKTIDVTRYNGLNAYYVVQLQPFVDEIHGMRIDDIQSAVWEIFTEGNPSVIKKMKLLVKLKPSLVRLYNEITYEVEISNVNKTDITPVPEEAHNAQRLS